MSKVLSIRLDATQVYSLNHVHKFNTVDVVVDVELDSLGVTGSSFKRLYIAGVELNGKKVEGTEKRFLIELLGGEDKILNDVSVNEVENG